MALLHFWKTNRDIVLSQTVQQVVSNAGDGNLRDGGAASQEFRAFLKLAPSEALFGYARQCLEDPFTKSGCVLQDIVNEFGEVARNSVESKRPSELIGYAATTPFAIGFLETAFTIEDSSMGI